MSLYLKNSSRLTEQLRDHTATLRDVTLPAKSERSVQMVPLKIVSSAAVAGESYRWEYTVEIASKEKLSDDWTGTDVDTLPKAYNGWEAANTATSVLALSGEDPGDLETGFTVDPLPNGLVTMGFLQYFRDADASNAGEFAFFLICEPNPIGGECP